MLNLKEWDVTKTRFYQEVLEQGKEQGREEGREQGREQGREEAAVNLIFRQLSRRCGVLSPTQEMKVRSLSISQLEALGEALLDFTTTADLETWLENP